MLRSNPASSMQKTYDEVYLVCSTAIYFEQQNNEEEALRSWREALDQIYYHNAYKIPANYRPKTETEKALQESLRNMELQCKERVDLFDTIRKSRLEKARSDDQTPSNGGTGHPLPVSRRESIASIQAQSQNDSLGNGTIAPSSYSSISRPPLPQRPSSRTIRPADPSRSDSFSMPSTTTSLHPSSAWSSAGPTKSSRSPSPEKRSVFRSTLRPEKKDAPKVASAKLPQTMRPRPPPKSAAQAATIAWPGANIPGLNIAANNASSSSLAISFGSSSRKGSMENSTTMSKIRHGSDRLTNLSTMQPQSPMLSLAQTRPSLSTISRPTSYETFPPRASPYIESNERNETSHVPYRAPPPPPPPHRARPARFPESPDESTKEESPEIAPPSPPAFPSYRKEYLAPPPIDPRKVQSVSRNPPKGPAKDVVSAIASKPRSSVPRKALPSSSSSARVRADSSTEQSSASEIEAKPCRRARRTEEPLLVELSSVNLESKDSANAAWDARVEYLMKNLPKGVDEQAAKAIFNEVVIKGDEVHWDDVAGLDVAKNALKEAVVYPFLRPDLFMGLREPARGMLLFGPPGTGKTMLARAVATESQSTFFAISASSLTSKFLGESEKLVRALFALAKAMTPSIIFVDEIDSLLSARAGSGEHEASRRIKTEFLIAWSDLAKAAAGREQADGDASRVLVLAATNLPWAIDEAARRRFVRRQYIPLPEDHVRGDQLRRLMSAQKHDLTEGDFQTLVTLTDGFSGSDITALAKDAAMGPLRSLGEQLLHMSPDQIRPINFQDFQASLINIRPSVSKQGLKEFEDWATQFGERGG